MENKTVIVALREVTAETVRPLPFEERQPPNSCLSLF